MPAPAENPVDSNPKDSESTVGQKRKGPVIWEEQCPFTNEDVLQAFGEEVHMFMHVHVRGYDRDGDGRAMDASYYDKYGAPIEQENAWMHGYHVIEKELAKHFNQCIDTNTMFPLVAGMAGGAHLYKPVGHDSKPWNWTGWVPKRKVWCTVNTFHKNRHFLNLRGNEIQNNLWDYHPYQEQEKAKDDDEKYEQVVPIDSFQDKGYWLKGEPWARYIHIIGLKSHGVDEESGNVLRYNYIVHPLAYRASINDSPDNHVDGVQWANLNVRYDGNFEDSNKWGTDMHGLEIFNDFTYFFSWCPKTKYGITCNNGTPQNKKENDDPKNEEPLKEYIYWHDTYPLEFGEFLLDTSYERGVYVHVLAANDAYYMKNLTPDTSDSHSRAKNQECKSIIYADPKGVLIKEEELTVPVNPDTYCTKTKKRLQAMKKGNKKLQECNSFFESRPYHSNTAFGHIALIDTEKTLHKTMSEMCLTKEMKSESEQVESAALKMLIDGKFFAHTGVYDLFKYQKIQTEQILPFVVHNQPDRTKMCYQLTEEMDLIFYFPRVKANKSHFVWRYSLEYEKADDKTFETVHGYFKMDSAKQTRLNLSDKYDKRALKWIQFASFKDDNPQRRAWFQAVRGLAFGDPKPKVTPPKRTHKVVLTKCNDIEHGSYKIAEYRETEEFTPFKLQLKSEANNLNFLFPQRCTDEEEGNIFVYDMQVCALLPEDNENTKESYRDPVTNKFIFPERFVQNVHGYFVLNNDYPTKLNLNYSWDGTTLVDQTVSFYCINSTGQPTFEFPHPTTNIPAEYKIVKDRNN